MNECMGWDGLIPDMWSIHVRIKGGSANEKYYKCNHMNNKNATSYFLLLLGGWRDRARGKQREVGMPELLYFMGCSNRLL